MWGENRNGECQVSKNTKRVAAKTKQQSTYLSNNEKKRGEKMRNKN